MKRNFIIACISAIMLTAVSCNEVKQTDIQPENNNSGISEALQDNSATDGNATDDDKEEVVITMASNGYPEGEFRKAIERFNEADNGYRIVTKRYDPTDNVNDENGESIRVIENEEDAIMEDFKLIQDAINTDDIDIFPSFAFYSSAKLEILKKMEAFVDLYSFMEDDPEVNTSTLNQHILSLNETDSKLYSIPVSYYASTLIGESKYVGDKENWTVDEFISHWEQMPEGSTVNGSINSENIYYDVLRSNLESFVDYENLKVNFDCPEFRKILEFCNRFESNNSQKGEYLYEAPRMVTYIDISGVSGAKLFGENGGEQLGNTTPLYTMVGYPSADGQGAFFKSESSYSISAKSSPEKQKGAWEFIRQFYTEEYQINYAVGEKIVEWDGSEHYSSEMHGFCINNNAFDNIAERTIAGEFDDGKRKDKDVEYTVAMPTHEEVDNMKKYLDSINRWETTIDRQLWNIIEKEVMAYFAGEKSLDETVDMIQNRASIWISEQY